MLVQPGKSVLTGVSWRIGQSASRYVHTCSSKRQTTLPERKERELRPVTEIPGTSELPFPLLALRSVIFDLLTDKKKVFNLLEKMLKRQGPIVRLVNLGSPPVVMLSRPEDIEKLMQSTFKNPLRLPMEASLTVKRENEFFENKMGILLENGEEWWRVRSRVQTPMMKPKIVQSYLQQMDEVALDFTDRISDFQSKFGEMPSDFQGELYKWALESVGLVALSRRLGCLDPSISEDSEPMKMISLVNTMFEVMNKTEMGLKYWKVFPSPSLRKLRKCQNDFLEIAQRNIRETEEALKARPADDEKELTLMEHLLLTPGLTRKDVTTLLMDMIAAGIDTTAHTMGFTLYLLARNPEAQAKLQAEVDEVLGDYQGPLLPKHLAKFTYMKAVLKESLRIFPIASAVGRLLDEDMEMCGYLIPKGHFVIGALMLSGMDERSFPRPKEFLPERWLRDRPLGPIHPYASLPFSIGTRMCIGRRIAEQEVYTLLARVMRRFTVGYKYKDIGVHTRLISMPSEPLKFTFTDRV